MENLEVILKRETREQRQGNRVNKVPTGAYTLQVIFNKQVAVSTKRNVVSENDYKIACIKNNMQETANVIVLNNNDLSFYKGLREDGTMYYYVQVPIYNMFNYSTGEDVVVKKTIWFNNQDLNLLSMKGILIDFKDRNLSTDELKEADGDND